MTRTSSACLPLALAGTVLIGATPAAADPAATVQTVLFIRHAEKSPKGLGQLSCKGLNRALALAGRLAKEFGHVDAIFVPDPAHQKEDGTGSFDYVRPLATVEPTAIRFGLPVHAALGYSDEGKLLAALEDPAYRSATVLVAWEHHTLQKLVPALLAASGGDANAVPKWQSDDFDSIWKVSITRAPGGDAPGGKVTSAFARDHQGLDGQPDTCPG